MDTNTGTHACGHTHITCDDVSVIEHGGIAPTGLGKKYLTVNSKDSSDLEITDN